jgi:hypothetical protein
MSSARRGESSADDVRSVVAVGKHDEPWCGSSPDDEDEECSPSQYQKARLQEESDAEESD